MPLTRNQKIGIAVGVGGIIALIGFSANASDDTPTGPPAGECPEGFIRTPDPANPGQFICMRGPDLPDVDDDVDDEPDNGPDDPFEPPPPNCNYAGCGAPFDNSHPHPGVLALRLTNLGYPINAIGIGQNGSTIAVNPARAIVREFQRDYNAVRAGNPIFAASPLAFAPIVAGPKLGTDGLIGNMTIAAIDRAIKAAQNANTTWLAAVELST
jgi:hypothetical protein